MRPFYWIAKAIAGKTATIDLLSYKGCPHHISLKPSDKKRLHEANLLIAVGPSFEGFLRHILEKERPQGQDQIICEREKLLTRSQHNAPDGHIWLDPLKMIRLARLIKEALTRRWPQNKVLYESNFQRFEEEVKGASHYAHRCIRPIQNKAYIIPHDLYTYFRDRYSLRAPYVIQQTKNPNFTSADYRDLHLFLAQNPDVPLLLNGQNTTPLTLQDETFIHWVRQNNGLHYWIDPFGESLSLDETSYIAFFTNFVQNFVQSLNKAPE
jgi:zinc transport system substrate-binding protein